MNSESGDERGRPRVLTNQKKQHILRLKEEDPKMTYREIGSRVGVAEGSIKRFFSELRKEERESRGMHLLTLEIPQTISKQEALQSILASETRQSDRQSGRTYFITLEVPRTISEEEALRRILEQPSEPADLEERGTHLVTLEISQTISEREALQRVIIPELKFDCDAKKQAMREAQAGRIPLEIEF